MFFASYMRRIKCIIMEKACNGQESESSVVFEVIGEPAIVINGVPDVTPGGTTAIHLDTICNPELSDDPCFGEWLEGRKIRKLFGDQYYSGKVVKYDSETKWYRVVYEDGDSEDLEWHEVEAVLLPLDISVPLTTLALQRCRSEKSVSESPVNMAKTRKNHTRSLGSMGKTLELLQIPQASEQKDGKQMEANFNDESIRQQTFQMQEGIQVENIETCLEMCRHEESVSKLGVDTATSKNYQNGESVAKMLEMFQRPETADIRLVQTVVHREVAVQESLKRQREIQKQNWKTARAEKQKRGEKSLVQRSAYRPE